MFELIEDTLRRVLKYLRLKKCAFVKCSMRYKLAVIQPRTLMNTRGNGSAEIM